MDKTLKDLLDENDKLTLSLCNKIDNMLVLLCDTNKLLKDVILNVNSMARRIK